MRGDPLLCIFVLLRTSFVSTMFYHEPSLVVLSSEDKNTDFGFSMGYRINKQQLIVGSPHADKVGKVYGCSIDPDPINKTCSDLNIDVKTLAPDYDKTDIDQSFCMGATISVTSNYFIACAPLWTSTGIKQKGYVKKNNGSYGTCFVYGGNNTDHAQRFNGFFEQTKKRDDGENYASIYGGIGWSSLADDENEVLLVAKPFDYSDIQYVNRKDFETDVQSDFKSLHNTVQNIDAMKQIFKDNTNIGYAMAAGIFFTDYKNTTFYALSMKDMSDFWHIEFLFKEIDGTMDFLLNAFDHPVEISFEDQPGDSFGVALASADIDDDGVTDLLVGAPTYSMPGRSETGALYIFKGGKMSGFRKRMFKIVSDEKQSRFGSAIVATDLDGDSLPEIFVSAPYENSGDGALYIISGYRLKKTSVSTSDLLLKDLTKLPGVQRIQNKAYRSFGFSLSVVQDNHGDGCNVLAVGSPQSSSVILFRCLPTVKATIEVKRPDEVKTSDSNFTVKLCVNVIYRKEQPITTQLQVVNKVIGKGATLREEEKQFDVDLSLKNTSYCKDVIVNVRIGETGSYSFTANLGYKDEALFKNTVFDDTWVRLSVNSKLTANTVIHRACSDDTRSCAPDLHMDILWDGSKELPKELIVNEKMEKNVTLVIRNDGAIAYDACVRVKVTGGAKIRIRCEPLIDHDQGEYKCPIPVISGKNSTHNLHFVVGIEKALNMNDTLHITADLYNDCDASAIKSNKIDINYILGMRNIFIFKSSHNVTVTDTQINNRTNPTFIDTHEYKIVNKGGLEWEDVSAIINVPSRPYIQSTHILVNEVDNMNCIQKNTTSDIISFICSNMKLYDVPLVINVRNEITYAKIMEHLADGKVRIDSNIEVRMASSNEAFQFPNETLTQTTIIKFEKETSLGNDKNAVIIIVVVAAIVIVLIVAFILYKIGFFQRKEKNRLESFKASIKSKKREDDKLSTTQGEELNAESPEESVSSGAGSWQKQMEDFDIEVIDDCAFEPTIMTTNDEAVLIEEDKNEPATSKGSKKEASSFEHNKTNNHKPSNNQTTAGDAPLVVDDKDSPEKGIEKIRQSTKM